MDIDIAKLEKKYGLIEARTFSSKLSTSLCMDLMLGGGLPSGRMITLFGMEQSGKSTICYSILKRALDAKIPYIFLFDYESSLDPKHFCNITGVKTIEDVFGKKDIDGQYSIKPKIKYYNPSVGEAFFRFIVTFLSKLPDFVKINNTVYLKYPIKAMTKAQRKKESFNADDFSFFKTKDRPQVVIVIDSYPAMEPESQDNNIQSNAIGSLARMFSTNLRALKSKLSAKGAILLGINQVRAKPMQMFGNPEYEPGGSALQFYSDIRLRISGVAIPHGKGKIEEEKSMTDGTDIYQYSKIVVKKNKIFPPLKETLQRIWKESDKSPGKGLDPVWDTFQYLKETNQLKRSIGKLKILLPGPWENTPITWEQFKTLVLKPAKLITLFKADIHILKSKSKKVKVKDILKQMNIRSKCYKQLKTGEAFDLLNKKEE